MFGVMSRTGVMELLRLAALAPLSSLTFLQAGEVAPFAKELEIPAGTRLLLDGPFAYELVVVEWGRAEVRFAGERVAELGPGDVFGTAGRSDAAYETASVSALEDMGLVTFTPWDLRRLRRAAPDTLELLIAAVRGTCPPLVGMRARTIA